MLWHMVVRWRFVLPSLITCISITSGLLSISEALVGQFESSAWFILLCVLLDKADGTVARLLQATSNFGIELDSLSDFLAFGVAPAIMVLALLVNRQWIPGYHYLVYVSCGLYVVSAALRLAKYNIKTEDHESQHFFGIPTTFCGALVCTLFLTARKYSLPEELVLALPFLLILLSLMMVSNIPLRKVGLRKYLPIDIFMVVNVFLVYLFGLLRIFPEYLLSLAVIYLVVGTLWATIGGVRPPASQ